jgi:hypothetical protein
MSSVRLFFSIGRLAFRALRRISIPDAWDKIAAIVYVLSGCAMAGSSEIPRNRRQQYERVDHDVDLG